ncbi:ATP-binding cassette domain-containing protein [Peptoniphilus equinus]|uniref:ATP-binding cassette domain-containing protein n=1 Tax=Peptoniphilus equinus TaxID=3016343 RepID=A0ABY7QWM3_9FIRM|nr:ATP-binding cassette domain-containing protein [Peptoniphilus equinus]
MIGLTIYSSNKNLSFLLFLIAPFYALINYFFRNKLKNAVIKNKKSDEKYFSIYFKLIIKIEYIKLNALKNKVLTDLNNEKRFFKQSKSKQIKYENIYIFVSSLMSNIFRVIYILLLGYFMIKRKITIGEFTTIITLSSQLLRYTDSIMDILRDWNVCTAHVGSLDEIIDSISYVGNKNKKLKQETSSINYLIIKNLSYKVDDNIIINDFSYNFQKGMIYTINGPNGSGKSTLLKIISGLLRDYDGIIKIDDCDIKNLDIDYLLAGGYFK